MNDSTLRHNARRIVTAGIEAVQPRRAIRGSFVVKHLEERLGEASRVSILAFGKAAAGMLESILPAVAGRIRGGILIVPEGYEISSRPAWLPEQIELAFGGHPQPSKASLQAGAKAVELAESLDEGDLLVALVSGGGSAMMDVYSGAISLTDAGSVTRQLLGSGADISEINNIRKHVSEIKGGRLAARVYPARTVVLAISDVPGDDPAVIASGPFSADPTTFADALAAAGRRSIELPASVRIHLERGAAGEVEESLKPGDVRLDRVAYHIVASNDIAVSAAAAEARSFGYDVVLASALAGEAKKAGRSFAARLREAPAGTCLIAGGETTVMLGTDPGIGGRNQEFGLAAAVHLNDAPGEWCILSAGTDGIDGVTDAAGAIIESSIWRAGVPSLDVANESLRRHDSYPFLKRRNMLLMTGPTGTNVMDIAIGLRG